MFKSLKGFTLIELLVVIAIIGILATVVIGSVNSARTKGIDSTVKGNLSNMRASAEIIYDTSASYDTVCNANTTTLSGLLAANKAVGGAATAGTETALSAGTTATLTAYCKDSVTAWVAANALKSLSDSNAAQYWCVDSTGANRVVASVDAAATACPNS